MGAHQRGECALRVAGHGSDPVACLRRPENAVGPVASARASGPGSLGVDPAGLGRLRDVVVQLTGRLFVIT